MHRLFDSALTLAFFAIFSSLVKARSMTERVVVRNIHSHNDYTRNLPFFDALEAGVTSFEADIYIAQREDFVDLAISHKSPPFRHHQSLKTVYLDPLKTLLEKANSRDDNSSADSFRGLYDNAPSTSIQLLLDYKIAGQYLHPIVIDYLSNLRARSLLTTYDAVTDKLTHRPITVVCSGRCLLEDVLGQQPRDIFFDAPLDKLDSFQYGPEVSPLASASLKKLFGSWGSGDLNEGRMKKIRPMLESANMRGIKTRFYDGPTWPPCVRNAVWKKLKQSGVYFMNVDDLKAGIRVEDNPESCIGIGLCRLWLAFQILAPTAIGLVGLRWMLDARRRVKLMRMVRRNQ